MWTAEDDIVSSGDDGTALGSGHRKHKTDFDDGVFTSGDLQEPSLIRPLPLLDFDDGVLDGSDTEPHPCTPESETQGTCLEEASTPKRATENRLFREEFQLDSARPSTVKLSNAMLTRSAARTLRMVVKGVMSPLDGTLGQLKRPCEQRSAAFH